MRSALPYQSHMRLQLAVVSTVHGVCKWMVLHKPHLWVFQRPVYSSEAGHMWAGLTYVHDPRRY